MIYTKPEISSIGSAIAEIQGTAKGRVFPESSQRAGKDTIAAYEADE